MTQDSTPGQDPAAPPPGTTHLTVNIQNVYGGAGAQGSTVAQHLTVPAPADHGSRAEDPAGDDPGAHGSRSEHAAADDPAAHGPRTENPAGESPAVPDPDLLARYLAAARRAALDRPYAGVLPGATPPPLATVYLQQQIRPQDLVTRSGRPRRAEGGPVSADTLLRRTGSSVILGGPGGGKSSLLRTCVVTLAGTPGATAVPVLVPAADLVHDDPLPTRLAHRVTALLKGGGLREELPPGFFRTQPAPGAHWLLLVDGLDEITDPDTRHALLRELAALADSTAAPAYRFVLTTRPLPGAELDVLDASVIRFELQPFGPGQVRDFAASWFLALGLPEPSVLAGEFTDAVTRGGLAELARSPLMATMLCQLYATDPGRDLPHSRATVYARFVDLLRQRQLGRGSGALDAQARAAWESCGPVAVAAARRTLAHLDELTGHLASELRRGPDDGALAVLARHPEAAAPPGVPDPMWTAFLGDVLRRSGLLVERAGDFEFWHRTLLEFLAAGYDTRDEPSRTRLYEEVFGGHPRTRPWARRHRTTPDAELSYLAFALTAWGDRPPAVAPALERLGGRGGPAGARFLAQLARAGAELPPRAARTAAHTLDRASRDRDLADHLRGSAAEYLVQVDARRGTDRLTELATDRSISHHTRLTLAQSLHRGGDPRGLGLIAALADNDAPLLLNRLWAAQALAGLGDPRGEILLAEIARASDPRDAVEAILAAGALSQLGNPRGAELLLAVADDAHAELRYRVLAAEALMALGHPYAGFLAEVAQDRSAAGLARMWAAKALLAVGDSRQADVLAEIAARPAAAGFLRVTAASHLAHFDPSRGIALLTALTNDPAVSRASRDDAARQLALRTGRPIAHRRPRSSPP